MKKRGSGEGSVYKLTNGYWRGAVSVGWQNGKRVRKVFTGKSRRDVQGKLTQALRDQQLGLNVAPERMTVGQYLSRWVAGLKNRLRPKTVRTYTDFVSQHLGPALGSITLAKLNPDHVRAFITAKLESGFLPRTVKHWRDALRAALNVAIRDGLIVRNAAALAEPPRVEKSEPAVYGPTEARRFLEAAKGDRLEALFVVGLSLGLREGEVLGLRWEDFSPEARTLSLRVQLQRPPRSEGRKVSHALQLVPLKIDKAKRVINLPPFAVSALLARRQIQEQERLLAGDRWKGNEWGLIFTTSVGTPFDQRDMLRSYYRILRQASLPRLPFHSLRHSAATLLLAQGVHPKAVQDLLGHSSIKITLDTYSHVIPSVQREVADRMEAILNPVATTLATKAAEEKPD